MRGDIRNGPYAGRAKEYVWSTIADAFPRNITPTDIDGMVEINRCFFLFEGKTEGCEMDMGQRLCFERLLLSMPEGRAVVAVCTHPPLDVVDTKEIRNVVLVYRRGDGCVKKTMPPVRSSLWHVAQSFVRDAQAGALNPSTWHGDYDDSPFEEVS